MTGLGWASPVYRLTARWEDGRRREGALLVYFVEVMHPRGREKEPGSYCFDNDGAKCSRETSFFGEFHLLDKRPRTADKNVCVYIYVSVCVCV